MTTTYALQHNITNLSDTLYISQEALLHLKKKKYEEGDDAKNKPFYFRITILSGGCAGFQYKFDFEKIVKENDLIFSLEEVNILTDQKSFQLVKNTTLHYNVELIGSSFSLNNPNSNSACGCGNSFAI